MASLVKEHNLVGRVTFEERDIFDSEFPDGYDDVLFVHQLVIWSENENKTLLAKAYKCLKPGGRIIVLSSISNDDRTGPIMAGLDTVYFQAIATGRGQIYPFCAYEEWLRDAGFDIEIASGCNSWTPHGIVVAQRPRITI